MITRQALIDLVLQQQETITLLQDTARHNYRVDSKAIELTDKWRDYWMKRAEKAENELIDIKLFGKTQPPQP
jgi:transposase-like protein